MNLLNEEVVLLAGATGRVGGATLALLLQEGARVWVVSRSRERAQALIDQVAADGHASQAVAHEADLVDAQGAEAAVTACLERFGRIDAVVNLAGQANFKPLLESTPEDLRSNVDQFLTLAYNLSMPALAAMLKQPARPGARSRGRIVTVTAGSSLTPQPAFGLFGAAKAGANVLMKAIAREHKADGIVANAVVLGTVATEAARDYLSPEDFAAASSPQEVADVLAFLASDRSSGINGALVDVNAREVD